MKLTVQPEILAVCRLGPTDAIPPWATAGGFFSVTRTRDELSIVCEEARVPADVKAERGWRTLKVEGPLDFSLTGILAGLSGTLAAAGVSLFAVSTFDTDYLLVREAALGRAVEALRANHHDVLP